MIASDTEKITCTNSEKQTVLPLSSGKKRGRGMHEDLAMMAAVGGGGDGAGGGGETEMFVLN